MDGALLGFRLKHPHLIEIRQAVPLRVVSRAASSHSVRGIFNFPGARRQPKV
jgi:hypothetical protein